MSKKKKKRKKVVKSFYIDTNIALDYATRRNLETAFVLQKIKEKGWHCVSSTFLSMEMADYNKDTLFIRRALDKKLEPRKILRDISGKKNLTKSDFGTISDWFEDFKKEYKKLAMYDFIQDNLGWKLAQKISFETELTAPDVIHLTSAIIGSVLGYCNVLITNDGLFEREANKVIEKLKRKRQIRVMSVAEVKRKFFTKKK